MVQISVRWCGELQSSEADIVQGLIVDAVGFIRSTTVSDTFGDGTTLNVFMILSGYSSLIFEIRRVPMPEPVPPPSECAVTTLGFLTNNIEYRVYQLSSFGIMALCPVVSSSALTC
ncbi:unnamed protein product [Pocillopora meandrina]|uniref:Uncharacterized protein n=1 Tax=Pocillopora meandrina TaxID=46732 RepID=A0AAU9VLV9_9CNID|nr:unnamed protein product [Pocillopora meandrina]